MPIYSVRIIRKENQIVAAEYVKQFFIFCGVYVNEVVAYGNCSDKVYYSMDKDVVDCNIWLIKKISDLNGKYRARKNVILNVEECLNLSDIRKRLVFGRQIKTIILNLFCNKENEEIKDIEEVYEAFINNDIAYINFFNHLFLNQMSSSEEDKKYKEKIYNAFMNCINTFYPNGSNFSGSVYKKFAYLNCIRKVNRICMVSRKILNFNVDVIMREAHKLSEIDTKFSAGNVLAFLVGITEYKTETAAEEYLKQAMEHEKEKGYFAFAFYEIARHYEITRHDWKLADILYRQGENLTPTSIKFRFKNASIKFRYKEYEASRKEFWNIYQELHRKCESGWISFQEAECYCCCAFILNEMTNLDSDGDEPSINIDTILEYIQHTAIMQNFIDKDDKEKIYEYYKKITKN